MTSIAIVAHDNGLRGAERFVLEEAVSLSLQSWDVTVVIPTAKGDLLAELRNRNLKVVTFPYYWWMGPGRMFGRVRRALANIVVLPRLVHFLKTGGFDLVHSHSIANGIGPIAARLSGVKCVWHLHEAGPFAIADDRPHFDLGLWVSRKIAAWTNSRFLAVSAEVARLYKAEFGIRDVSVTYQSVALDADVAAEDADIIRKIKDWPGPRLIIVGALLQLKGQLTAVGAMEHIVRQLPDTGLFLVGNDPVGIGAEIEDLAKRTGISGNVVQTGPMANAVPAIGASDLCIVTALDEGFGRVAVEAMLSGTPVLAAARPVNLEVTGHKHADYFEPGDDISLATVALECLSRPKVASRAKTKAAQTYADETFNKDAAIASLTTALEAAINGPRNV